MVGRFQTNRRINPTIGRIKRQFVGLKSVLFYRLRQENKGKLHNKTRFYFLVFQILFIFAPVN